MQKPDQEQFDLEEGITLLEESRERMWYGMPYDLGRPKLKKTRLFLDNEFIKLSFAARFRKYHLLEVYAVLCMHANADEQTCFPSLGTIMRLTGIHNKNQVSRALQILEALDIIFVRHSKGRYPNHYLLLRTELWRVPDSITFDTDDKLVVNEVIPTVSEEKEQYQTDVNSSSGDTRTQISN